LLYWTNGGPGCSSQLGWVQEIGPFLFKGTNTSFYPNLEYSWNRKANLLFLENPPGVGYSIQNITGYTYSDENSGVSNFLAL
jgi:serine carboxypeptidase-like clade II